MLKSFDIADNFTGILSAGVVAAIPPVANANNLPLMSSNTSTNNVLDTTSMKNLKNRPHPYLREQTPLKLQSQQPQIQQTATLQQQQLLQQQQHLQQQQQQLQQLQEQQQRIQEQITSVGGVINSVSGFGLSAMNSSPPLSVLTATVATAAPMEMPIAPMIKADPDAANNNENNSLELLVNGGNMGGSGGGGGAGSILNSNNNNGSSNSGSGNPGTEDGSSNGGGNDCSVVIPDVSVSLTQTNPLELESLETNPKDVDEFAKDQPDPDNIKMFVGQIPKSMDETQLRKMFELYGRVHTINVLRDKLTLQSRGCCFVTYYTRKAALKAQDALHNIKTLDGMHHPIQMKPADSENRNERKLFVGMLNKKFNESEVRQLFAGHGTIEECTVLRDQNGQSKGCAFVTFSTKQAAIGAIKSLHQSQTMEGCSAPLVVKFADTQKEKDQKKLQQLQATLVGNGLTAAAVSSSSVVARTNPTVQALATPSIAQSAAAIAATPSILAANPPQQASPYLAADAMATPSQMQLFQQLQTFGIHPQFLQGLNFPPDHSATTLSTTGGLIAPMSMQGLVTLATLNPSPHHTLHTQHPHLTTTHPHLSAAGLATSPAQPISAQLTNTTSGPNAAATLWTGTESLTSPYAQSLTQLSNGTFAAATAPLTASALTAAAAGVAGKQIEGPEGSNLFIYHLPQEFNDTDLATTFLPFGNVLSAKVFIDKQTNLSKCFGFVSYDNPHSANAAIQAMHGFQIGTKRLKVQLKRSKDAAKPY